MRNHIILAAIAVLAGLTAVAAIAGAWSISHRPRRSRAAQCEYEFSPSDVDCHATLLPEVVCMQ